MRKNSSEAMDLAQESLLGDGRIHARLNTTPADAQHIADTVMAQLPGVLVVIEKGHQLASIGQFQAFIYEITVLGIHVDYRYSLGDQFGATAKVDYAPMTLQERNKLHAYRRTRRMS